MSVIVGSWHAWCIVGPAPTNKSGYTLYVTICIHRTGWYINASTEFKRGAWKDKACSNRGGKTAGECFRNLLSFKLSLTPEEYQRLSNDSDDGGW